MNGAFLFVIKFILDIDFFYTFGTTFWVHQPDAVVFLVMLLYW